MSQAEAKEVRVEIGADILIAMAANEEFPMGNINRVVRVMNEYFDSEGFEDVLIQNGYTWRPTEDYWIRHFKELREYLRINRRIFLEYERGRKLQGNWKFLKKGDFEKVIKRERAGIMTRTETYNDRLEEAKEKWKLEEPKVHVSLLTG